MDVARRKAEEGAPEGTVVLADQQTRGRGRFRRRWVSPPGTNLYLSIILRPTVDELRLLNMATSLAVVRAIRSTAGLAATIKWPNDVRLRELKVGGILIDSALSNGQMRWTIVGVGINVNLDPAEHPEIASIATSLAKEAGHPVSRMEVLAAFLEELNVLYETLRSREALAKEWKSFLDTLGKTIQVRIGKRIERGVAQDVDEAGNLVLVRSDGSIATLAAGEVTLQS